MKLDLRAAAEGGAGDRAVVALRHDRDGGPGAGVPLVVAKGRGELADRILALAREHDLPVCEDRDLLQLLAAVPLGDEIPADLYEVVAELLAFLYRANETAGSQRA